MCELNFTGPLYLVLHPLTFWKISNAIVNTGNNNISVVLWNLFSRINSFLVLIPKALPIFFSLFFARFYVSTWCHLKIPSMWWICSTMYVTVEFLWQMYIYACPLEMDFWFVLTHGWLSLSVNFAKGHTTQTLLQSFFPPFCFSFFSVFPSKYYIHTTYIAKSYNNWDCLLVRLHTIGQKLDI